MKLKKGDSVIVMSGKDKGKSGVIQRSFPKLEQIIVDGINLKKKHQKPTQANPDGSIVEIYAPIFASKVMLADPKTKKPTRVGYKTVDGKKVRYSKDSGSIIG
jgi:large subunit ribosomal protein L24